MPTTPVEVPPLRVHSILGSRFGNRVVALFLALVVLLATVATQVYRVIGEFVEAADWVTHTFEVKQAITSTVATLRDIEASQRAYILSGDPQRLADYHGLLPRIASERSQLAALIANNPQQVRNVAALGVLLDTRLQSMAEILQIHHDAGLVAARDSAPMRRSRSEDREIDALASDMSAHEDALLDQRERHTLERSAATRLLTMGAIGFCIAIIALALVVVVREQRRRLSSEISVRRSNIELGASLAEAQRLGHTLRQLSELGEMLQGCRDLGEAVAGLRVTVPRLMPGQAGSVSLINASQNLVESVARWGEPAASSDSVFAPDDCWALRRGQAYPAAGSTPTFQCSHLHGPQGEVDSPAHLCVPLVAHGEMLGILTLTADTPISQQSRSVALAAGEQVSMALANLKLQETLRSQSLRDPLTGLFNRRYLEVSLERETQRASRRGQPLSVLMLDIDHFKRFNDSHGHDAGDALLAQFGALLTRTVRNEDVACRYGGEEFTIVMQETTSGQALERAEQICAAVRTLDVQHRRQTLGPVSVSIGIATLPADGSTPAELLRSADRALYAAKNAGRDQVRLAE